MSNRLTNVPTVAPTVLMLEHGSLLSAQRLRPCMAYHCGLAAVSSIKLGRITGALETHDLQRLTFQR